MRGSSAARVLGCYCVTSVAPVTYMDCQYSIRYLFIVVSVLTSTANIKYLPEASAAYALEPLH